MRWLVLLVVVSGCVSSNVVVCADGRVCPSTKVCDDAHSLCVFEAQFTECAGLADRTECSITEADGEVIPGTCHELVCLPAGCGNDRLDRIEDEVCDDGDQTDGNGCSADCKSVEVCGNGTIDLLNPSKVPEQCDDANSLSHDGCNRCISESSNWTPYVDPVPQFDARLTYDAARDVVVMMGGRVGNDSFSSRSPATAEWNGAWYGDIITPPPPTRGGIGLAYHHEIRRTVIYAGVGVDGSLSGETWLWDGVSWEQGPTGPKRRDVAMAYDAKRKRIVAFGGQDEGGNRLASTLEFDGTAWQDVSPATGPSARSSALMVYDSKRGVIVMVAGSPSEGAGVVWEYDGTTWTRKAPTGTAGSTLPNELAGMAFGYDPIGSRAMLYGGRSSSSPTSQLWQWDGTSWTLYGGATPTARSDAALVYDGRGRMMVFGGRTATTGTTVLGDTWFYDGLAWAIAANPPARALTWSVISYDQGKVLRYGGQSAPNAYTNEVWERTRRGWKQFSTAGDPPARSFTNMVYDSARRQFVLFGGVLTSNTLDPKIWLRTGETWTSQQPGIAPAARAAPVMAYDAARGNTIVLGGFDAQVVSINDMWTWNGSWAPVSTPLPTPRFSAAAGYDPVREQVVVFGGYDANSKVINETWVWDGMAWHDVTPSASPPPMLSGQLVWNPARQSLTLAGPGMAFVDQSFETWEWIGNPTSPPSGSWRRLTSAVRPSSRSGAIVVPMLDGTGIEASFGVLVVNNVMRTDALELTSRAAIADDSCQLPFDVDGDSLIGCLDPDCWPVCSPLCPPGVTCPAAAPRCGDNACSSIESRTSCPADCGTMGTPVCGDFVCEPGEQCPGDC